MVSQFYAHKLENLSRRVRLRKLERAEGFDFSSNDYLGLASAPEIAEALVSALQSGVPAGAGGSRLLRGHHEEHELLEQEAAAFFGSERMLYMGSGYAANLALLSTLPQPDDLILYDHMVHASQHDGMRASRAMLQSMPHNNANAFEDGLRAWREQGAKGRPWIVVESLYSMDGDCAPLADLASIANRYDAFLCIDEAHATGVHGSQGRGLAADLEGCENVMTVHTCGKALGGFGALIGASSVLCDYIINRARPFIYATAPPPLQAHGVRAALSLLQRQPERRAQLKAQMEYAHRLIHARLGQSLSETQIIPVIIGEDARAMQLSHRLRQAGFDVRAIRPPTVPARTARLRITLTLNVDHATIERMVDCLATLLEEQQ